MAILIKKLEDIATEELLFDLKKSLLNDSSLNQSFIKDKNWVISNNEDNQLFDEDAIYLEQALIDLGQSKFYAVLTDDILLKSFQSISVQEVDVDHFSIAYLQNPYNEITMSNSMFFSYPNLNFLILRPCTLESRLYIAGPLDFVKHMCQGTGWSKIEDQ